MTDISYPGLGQKPGHLFYVILAGSLLWPGFLLLGFGLTIWWIVRGAWRHKATTLVLSTYGALAVRLGLVEAAGLLVGLGLVLVVDLVVWRLCWPVEFARFVSEPRGRRRRRRTLSKGWEEGYMVGVGLGVASMVQRFGRRPRSVTTVPALRSVTCGEFTDELIVRPLPHQDVHTFEARTDALGMHLGALRCRVAVHDAGHLRVELLRRDPLAALIPPFPIRPAGAIDLAAIPVGRREDGAVYTVSVTGGRHLFIAGETEAGKSSYVWSIIAGLAPLVAAGVVRLWGVDPKCQEFPYGAAMFHRLATMTNPDGMADLLEEAAETLQAKAAAMSGVQRRHIPTAADPHDVVIVDEMGFLTAYFGDAKFRKRVSAACSVIATQGRTTGFELIGCAQDPGKEVLPFRQLFPARIALRLREPLAVDMVLGGGARAAGARCDEIPESLRGVGYVQLDGMREPTRIRAAYLDDDAITRLAAAFPAPAHRLTIVQGDEGVA